MHTLKVLTEVVVTNFLMVSSGKLSSENAEARSTPNHVVVWPYSHKTKQKKLLSSMQP